jgi:hypothetical protein
MRLLMKAAPIVILTLGFIGEGRAAFEPFPVGARTAGMAGIVSVGGSGPETVFGNPALLGGTESVAFVFDASRLYGLSALGRTACAASVKLGDAGAGLGFQTFGSSLYRETAAVLSIGFSRGFMGLGLSARALGLTVARYGSARTGVVDAGMALRLSQRICFGAVASNILAARIGERQDTIPRVLRLGFSVAWLRDALFCLEAVKDTEFPVDLRSGCEFRLKPVVIRIGVGRDPSVWTCGFGLNLGPIRLDYAMTDHPVLGATHQASIILELGNR